MARKAVLYVVRLYTPASKVEWYLSSAVQRRVENPQQRESDNAMACEMQIEEEQAQ